MDQRLIRILGGATEQYPYALESKFPRILETIMSLWDDPEKADDYFMGLMVSDRPNRTGFPPDVATDIMHLNLIHAARAPAEQSTDIWEASPSAFSALSKKSETSPPQPAGPLAAELEKYGVPATPEGLLEAAESGKRAAVAILLDANIGAEVRDNRGWTPLMMAAFNGRDEIVSLLLGRCDVNSLDLGGNSALHWAAFAGHLRCAQMLIQNRARIDEYNNFGWTPLIQATARNHADIVKLLIDNGVNVNAEADDGYTALHKAAASENPEIAKMLLEAGADKNHSAIDGETPVRLAKKSRRQELIRLFEPGANQA